MADDVRIDTKEVDGIMRATIDQMPRVPLSYQAHFTGRLRIYPLSGALFPNWPDYSRKSWREGIIATAYGRAPIITPASTQTARPVIAELRDWVSGQISAHLSPASANLAKALLIGERDFSNEAFFTPFRKAGLAISGDFWFAYGVILFRRLWRVPLILGIACVPICHCGTA